MATLASSALTLGEWATRLDPGGKPAAVIELLGQTNEMLTDMLWMQCNDGAGHKTTVRGLFPKGSKAGLQVRDLGEHSLFDANNNPFQGYRTHFKWDCGLTVRDWRFVVRIANINVTAGAVTTANLVNTLIAAVNKLPFVSAAGNSPPPGGTKPGQVNTAFYCNRTVRAALDIQAMAKANNFLTLDTRDSKPYVAFRGIPIRICDQIVTTNPAWSEERHPTCSSTNRTSSRPMPGTARPAPAAPRRPTSSTWASPATSAAP